MICFIYKLTNDEIYSNISKLVVMFRWPIPQLQSLLKHWILAHGIKIILECYPFRRLAGKRNSISEDLMNMNNILGW